MANAALLDVIVRIARLTGSIGASVEGVDLREIGDAAFAMLLAAFHDHCVLVIRGQYLEAQHQLAFGRRFGKLVMTLGTEKVADANAITGLDDHPEILRVRNVGKAHAGTEAWHADNCHVEHPTAISILAAVHLPDTGGDTIWSNQYLAYETLSEGMQRMLRGLRLKHTGATQAAFRGKQEGVPWQFHPLIRTHPHTARRALFIGGRPGPNRPHFEGMSERESAPLQQFLLEHSIQPDRCYRHQWQPGDVVMWDNRCTLHYAVHDYGDAQRDLNRVTVEGEKPFEAPYLS